MRCLLCVLALIVGCVAPDQNDPVLFRTYGVALVLPLKHADPTLDAGPWRPDQVEIIQRCYRTLNRLGPSFEFVPEMQAQIWVRPYNAFVDSMDPRQVGRYWPGTPLLECDPGRTPGYEALCACLAHETGHLLGMQHICVAPGELPACSPVGYGFAVMNPSIVYGESATNETFSQSTPTDLDLAEFRRSRDSRSP